MAEHPHYVPEILKHPLIVVVVTAIVGSFVVPRINSQIDRERRQRELRETRAVTVLSAGLETERKLNLVQTEFETFYKDIAAGNGNEQARKDVRDRVRASYRDFDREAWWWPYQTLDEIRMLRLMNPQKIRELAAEVEDYHQALLETTRVLDPYWQEIVHAHDLVSPLQATETVKNVQPQLDRLGQRRRKLIEQMVSTIAY